MEILDGLGLNVSFGLLLLNVSFFSDVVVWIVPDWIMHPASIAGLDWLAVMLTVAAHVVVAVRVLVLMATRN